MAGNYPDVPSRRMAYDGDGSVAGYRPDDRPSVEFTPTQMTASNSEETSGIKNAPQVNTQWTFFIFPELREVDGYFVTANGDYANTLEESGDSTNGVDGTWTTVIGDVESHVQTYDLYRDEITATAQSSVRCLRQQWARPGSGLTWRQTHIYGDITPGQTPDRLLFIDETTGLEFTASYDFGNVPRGGSEDIEWRIKNNSASLQANTIQYAAESLYLASAAWYTHTLPAGATFQGTRQVASLAASTTSGLIKTRRITPGDEVLDKHAARLYLNVDTWT